MLLYRGTTNELYKRAIKRRVYSHASLAENLPVFENLHFTPNLNTAMWYAARTSERCEGTPCLITVNTRNEGVPRFRKKEENDYYVKELRRDTYQFTLIGTVDEAYAQFFSLSKHRIK